MSAFFIASQLTVPFIHQSGLVIATRNKPQPYPQHRLFFEPGSGLLKRARRQCNLNLITTTAKSSGSHCFVLAPVVWNEKEILSLLEPRMGESDWNGRPFCISEMESLHPTVKFHVQSLCHNVWFTGNSETVMWWSAVQVRLYWLHYGLKDTGFRPQEGQEIFNFDQTSGTTMWTTYRFAHRG
jgi:hypothetical protein